MARIRTIKPELPQSESMGKVSRDARLLFILTWTLADDSGRLRGSSRMLASLLFPYDDDAPRLVDKWVAELSAEGCIDVYSSGGSTYIQIAKWLNHQKIDKPSPSKIPPFDESSRILANVRGGIKDQGPKDQGPKEGTKTGIILVGQKQPDAVDVVFTYWQKVMGHAGAKLDAKRSKAIKARLIDGYLPEQLCQAVDGCKLSPHHQGQNESRTVYDDIELICRDGAKVDGFIKRANAEPTNGRTSNQQQTIDALNRYLENNNEN